MNKNQELEELFQTVSQIYTKNINFFEKNHKYIYQKIKNFEALKIENYFLEFKNNHFELIDKDGFEFYKCNPFFDAQKRCNNLENKPCFNLLKDKKIEYGVHYENSINANEFINDFLKLPNSNKLKYDKFIFLGTLLGVHLNDLAKVLKSFVYLICEDSIEIFRLSLFLTDYEEISKNAKLFFCIEENKQNFEEIIKTFLNFKTKYNHKIFFEIANEQNIHFIDKIKNICIDFDPYNYPFSEYLTSLKRAIYYKKNSSYGILKCAKKQNIFEKPILFLAAGPSLEKNIEFLKSFQDRFIIVCIAAALKRLEIVDIIPDIILSADGQYWHVARHFNVNEKYFKNSIAIISVKSDFEISKNFDFKKTFFMPDNIEIFENTGLFTGVSVGDIGLDFLLRFGAKQIYLLGLDASLSEYGATHDSSYKKTISKEKHIYVKGNFKKQVATTSIFDRLISSINFITSKKQKDANIYNLSNGAYFENTTPLDIKNLNLNNFEKLDKCNILEKIRNSLIEKSSKCVSSKDMVDIKKEQKIIKKIKKIKKETLEQDFNQLSSNYKNSICIQVVKTFFDLIKPYCEYKKNNLSIELEYKQFLEVVEDLENSIFLV